MSTASSVGLPAPFESDPLGVAFPPDHPQRVALADEVHARPPGPVNTPSRASYLAVLIDPEARAAERAHLRALCEHWGTAPPSSDATHFRAQLGPIRLKWERHGEFSGYTFFIDAAADTPFASPATASLPRGWLSAIPGQTIAAVHAEVSAPQSQPPDSDALAQRFGSFPVAGARIVEGAGMLFTDFRLHEDGCSRVWLLNERLTPPQAGRIVQRLFEIEAYRVLALLALPIARRQAPRIAAIEQALATLTDQMASEDPVRESTRNASESDEALLHALMRLAAEVESGIAAGQFRYGACEAYHGLVQRRIAELREERLPGLQTIEEFMGRRLDPAVATCMTTSQRLADLADRIGQTSALLATRVGIASERQNQDLLASMDRRARLQLRLQQTVEGLSIAAIVYYVAGLTGYVSKALHAAGVPVDPDLVVGGAIPLAAALLLRALRRMRARLGIEAH